MLIVKPHLLYFCESCHGLQSHETPCHHVRLIRPRLNWLAWGLCLGITVAAWYALVRLVPLAWRAVWGG